MSVALAVGGSFLSAFLQVLFDRMASVEFISLFRENSFDIQLLNKLQRALMSIDVVLDDAETKHTRSIAVGKWLNELKDAVFLTDDLMDVINTEALRVAVESNHVRSTSYGFMSQIIPKIMDMTDTLQYFAQQIEVLGLEKGVSMIRNSSRLPSSSLVNELMVYGTASDKKMIMHMLSDKENDSCISVVSIVGMGGVGKTTLAQLVYNDESVKKHFDMQAWVCVSEEYDAVRITKTLLGELTSWRMDSSENFNLLQVKLKDEFVGKRFLLVLDDIWNISYVDWDILRKPFWEGRNGSKIIVTTRDDRVAAMMGCTTPYYLKPISDEDGWSLLHKHAFENRSVEVSTELEVVGKEIVKICRGLPLVLKTIGGLLRSKSSIQEWENVLRSPLWELPSAQSGILPGLKLSYNHLPSHLKRCFAFCAVFPKDYMISKKEIILLWLASDFLYHPRKNMEEVGEEYIQELISRSFFQQMEGDYVIMHDLINDLAQFIAGEFSSRLDHQQFPVRTKKLRHLSYSRGFHDTINKFNFLKEAQFLRTLLPISELQWSRPTNLPDQFLHEILPSLTFLRVLSLSHYRIPELPPSIGTLQHLRLLDLSFNEIKRLPDSVTRLYNLKVLLLCSCHSLVALPANMMRLVNLQHLDISGSHLADMPRHMSRLKNLNVLTYFTVGKRYGYMIEELGELCNLRCSLSIRMLQNVSTGLNALKARMKDKKFLKELILEWGPNNGELRNSFDVLYNLEPHKNLTSLTIRSYDGIKFPDWVGRQSFRNIVSLHVEDCENCVSLPALGQLSSLKFLTIRNMDRISNVGQEFYGNAIHPFRALLKLVMENLLEWEEWTVGGSDEFAALQTLTIVNCPKLIGKLPNKLVSLKSLDISRCPKLVIGDGFKLNSGQVLTISQHLSSLHKLIISGLSNMEELPSEMRNLSSLKELMIQSCPNLKSFANNVLPITLEKLTIEQCHALLSLPEGTTQVNELNVHDCQALVSFPVGNLATLTKDISISNCMNLKFPTGENDGNFCFNSLERMMIKKSCNSLLHMSLSLFPKLQSLRIYECEDLRSFTIPDETYDLPLLLFLEICDCNNLESFPTQGLPASSLAKLIIWFCKKLTSLPSRMQNLLPSLQSLEIGGCPEIESLPGGGLPDGLERLSITDCINLVSHLREWDLRRLHCLRELEIGGDSGELFPDEGLLPGNLRSLSISDNAVLETLNEKGLQNLETLETLSIWHCRRLRSLESAGLNHIGSLRSLYVRNCPGVEAISKEWLPPYLSQLRVEECPLMKAFFRRGHKIDDCDVICDDEVIQFDDGV